MKALRITVTPAEVTPTPLGGCAIPPHKRIPEMAIAPNKLLKIKGGKGTSQ